MRLLEEQVAAEVREQRRNRGTSSPHKPVSGPPGTWPSRRSWRKACAGGKRWSCSGSTGTGRCASNVGKTRVNGRGHSTNPDRILYEALHDSYRSQVKAARAFRYQIALLPAALAGEWSLISVVQRISARHPASTRSGHLPVARPRDPSLVFPPLVTLETPASEAALETHQRKKSGSSSVGAYESAVVRFFLPSQAPLCLRSFPKMYTVKRTYCKKSAVLAFLL